MFPDTAPGNFTFDAELGRWVWTTFNAYQWDLDHANPEVFVAMAAAMLELAAVGVDVLRLDAVPFLWKRMGTDCQNQPEVHDLLQAYRAVVRIAAPAVAFKAEAIVAPRDLVAYLGVGRHEGMECDLAYHNVLMVLLWSTLASRRVALLARTLASMPPVPAGAGWLTYVRCHDDIGWAITDEDAGAVGEDAHLHRRFLTEFYSGAFPGSFARGAPFQPEPDGEARISGMRGIAGRARAGAGGGRRARRRSSRCDGCSSCTPWRSRSAGSRSSTWATSSRCATTPAGRRTPRMRTTRGGCTARRWTGRPPPAARTRTRPRAACGQGCDGSSRRAAGARRCTGTASHGRSRRAIRTSSGSCASTRAERMLLLASFSEQRRPIALSVLAEHGVEAGARAGEPDGRPLRIDGETLVLEPFQHAWCDG